jgi:hypothetical protein
VFRGGTVLCAFVNDSNRKFHRAFNGVREGNFGIDGLLGFDLHGSNAGIVGTGTIGLLRPTVGSNGLSDPRVQFASESGLHQDRRRVRVPR